MMEYTGYTVVVDSETLETRIYLSGEGADGTDCLLLTPEQADILAGTMVTECTRRKGMKYSSWLRRRKGRRRRLGAVSYLKGLHRIRPESMESPAFSPSGGGADPSPDPFVRALRGECLAHRRPLHLYHNKVNICFELSFRG